MHPLYVPDRNEWRGGGGKGAERRSGHVFLNQLHFGVCLIKFYWILFANEHLKMFTSHFWNRINSNRTLNIFTNVPTRTMYKNSDIKKYFQITCGSVNKKNTYYIFRLEKEIFQFKKDSSAAKILTSTNMSIHRWMKFFF